MMDVKNTQPVDGVAYIRDGWFFEKSTQQLPGQMFGIEIEEILFHEKSKFQDVFVFKSKTFGRVLVLDGIVQCTELDECSYQEMMAFLPMAAHSNPKQVLIIGGGDGGVARDVLKFPGVERVVLCDIDEMVIEVSKKYLPFMACSFDDPRMTLHIGDGINFMKEHKQEFDVIITDSSDPVGPACVLFEKPYYALMKEALREGGIVASQAMGIWFDNEWCVANEMMTFCRSLFPQVQLASINTPTYPAGQVCCLVCSLHPSEDVRVPRRVMSEKELEDLGLRYYSSELHTASFTLPTFVNKAIREGREDES